MQPAGLKNIMGEQVPGGLDLVRLIRDGLPVDAIDHVMAGGWLSAVALDRIVLPRRTLSNRRKTGRLTAEQSDRLVRVVRLLALTAETFREREKAARWLRRPTSALGGEMPLDLLDTDDGARAVENLLGRIAHGIAA